MGLVVVFVIGALIALASKRSAERSLGAPAARSNC